MGNARRGYTLKVFSARGSARCKVSASAGYNAADVYIIAQKYSAADLKIGVVGRRAQLSVHFALSSSFPHSTRVTRLTKIEILLFITDLFASEAQFTVRAVYRCFLIEKKSARMYCTLIARPLRFL